MQGQSDALESLDAGNSTSLYDAVYLAAEERLKEGRLKSRDFSPQFSVKHMHKDMRLAEASQLADLPLLGTVRACLARAEAQGMGDDDFSSVIRLLGG